MKAVFVETGNVAKFRRAAGALEDVEKGQPGIMLAWGQAGRGKTVTVQNYYAERGGIFLRIWENWTQTAFLQALCFEIANERPRSANACKLRIMKALDDERRTIFVDEADRLPVGRLEDLRDIHDVTGCPIVLVGEEELLSLLGTRRRIWSRVTQETPFGPVEEADIVAYALEAAGLDLDAEACALIRKRSDGDFRLVHNMVKLLEDVARARETDRVSAAMVSDILKNRSWRRG